MAKRYRWKCPQCEKAKLGGQRPGLESVVRFCLPCSERTGKLVRTESPVLRARADAKAGRAKAKRAMKGMKEREKWMRGGLDVRKEVARCAKVLGIFAPKVTIRNRTDGRFSGGSYKGRVVLSLGVQEPRSRVLALITHEMAHEAAWRAGHGPRWRAKYLELVRRAYGVDAGDPGGSSYALTVHVTKAFEEE